MLLFATSTGELMEKLMCNVDECLVWIASIFNLFTLFVLAILSFAKPSKLTKLVGLVWTGLAFCAAVLIVFLHACILTILSTIFTGFLLVSILSISLSIPSYSEQEDYSGTESERGTSKQTKKGMYIIHSTPAGLSFSLNKNAKVQLAKSVYVYNSVEIAKKGIAVSRENGMLADLQDLTATLIREARCPKFEAYEENGAYYFRFAINSKYVILVSDKFDKKEDCLKAMKLASQCVCTSELYYSSEEDSSYADAQLDPFVCSDLSIQQETVEEETLSKLVERKEEKPQPVAPKAAATKAQSAQANGEVVFTRAQERLTFEQTLAQAKKNVQSYVNEIISYIKEKKNITEFAPKFARRYKIKEFEVVRVEFKRGNVICKFMTGASELKHYQAEKNEVSIKEQPVVLVIDSADSVVAAKRLIDIAYLNIEQARNEMILANKEAKKKSN